MSTLLAPTLPAKWLREALEALVQAEDVLARAPYSTEIWPNGTHPNTGITMIREAISCLTAALSSAAPDEGWRLVPVEPTPEMLAAALRHTNRPDDDLSKRLAAKALTVLQGGISFDGMVCALDLLRDYRKMLAAAPSPSPSLSPAEEQRP